VAATGTGHEGSVSGVGDELVRVLCEIATDDDSDLSSRMRRMLRSGCDLLGMEVGIVARIDQRDYAVMTATAPSGLGVREGAVFDLKDTFCAETIAASGPVCFQAASSTGRVMHPAHLAFGFESYVGAPILVEGHTRGTVNFSSRTARGRPFGDDEIACVRLMAQWIGAEWRRQAVERSLAVREQQFRQFVARTPAAVAIVDLDLRYIAVSERWREDYGLGDVDLLGQHHYDVFPEIPPHWRAIHQRCLEGETERHEGERFERADGSIDWVRWEVRPWRDDEGAIGGMVMYTEIITDQKRREDALRRAAMHDRLTGLPNRDAFMTQVSRSIERARRRPEEGFALLFLDFDRFKVVNDSLGHDVGDQLLKSISERIQETLRGSDLSSRGWGEHTPGRLGGDEFVVLLEGVDTIEDATNASARLQRRLAEPHTLVGREIVSTASVGVVVYDERYERAEEMLRDADTAMYKAKRAGRDRVIVFDETMHEEAVERLEMEEDLRRSVDRDEVSVALQPILSLRTGEVCGFESLMRWAPEGRDEMNAGRFLPVAIETGLIASMSLHALERALDWFRVWSESRPSADSIVLNVNLARAQMMCDDHVGRVLSLVQNSQVDPQHLELEIAADTVEGDEETLIRALSRFKDAGLRIAFTELGAGSMPLYHLHRFPLDTVKIDRTYVASLSQRTAFSAVVHAVISLAHGLGLRVIGEGVETREQLAHLQALDADAAQGWFFSRPLNPEEAGKFARRQRAILKRAA